MQLLVLFTILSELYSQINKEVRTALVNDMKQIQNMRDRNLELYKICKNFNLHYNVDIIFYLSFYQMTILSMSYEVMKTLTSGDLYL